MGGFSSNSGGGGSKSGGNPNYSNNNANTGNISGASFSNNSTRGSNFGRTVRSVGNTVSNAVSSGGITASILKGVSAMVTAGKKKNKEIAANDALLGTSDYQGDVERSQFSPTGNPGETNDQGIEIAKKSTTSATILGPAEIQKEAANNIKGPTTTEMSAQSTPMTASQISLANKRKGRRATNITAKKTLANNYTLSKKTLLG